MIIRVSDPAVTADLVRELDAQVQYVVQQTGESEVAVSVLGSFADGGEMSLALFLATWQIAYPHVTVELVER